MAANKTSAPAAVTRKTFISILLKEFVVNIPRPSLCKTQAKKDLAVDSRGSEKGINQMRWVVWLFVCSAFIRANPRLTITL
jgi:hypothetical protein